MFFFKVISPLTFYYSVNDKMERCEEFCASQSHMWCLLRHKSIWDVEAKERVYVKALALALCGKSLSPKVTMPKCSQCIFWAPTIADRVCICLWAPLPPRLSHKHLWKPPWEGRTWNWIYSYVFLTNVACGSVFVYLAFSLLESMWYPDPSPSLQIL